MKVLMVGCGAVAQCTLPLLLQELNIDPHAITVIDFVDNRHRIVDALQKGVTFVQETITKENYASLLTKYLNPGDLFIDLAWDLDTCALLQWCHDNNVLYVNASVELWEPYTGLEHRDIRDLTLYARQMNIRKLQNTWTTKGPTAVVDHGANPGLVSHFAKQALQDIAHKIIQEKPNDMRIKDLQQALDNNNFAALAHLTGVKTIHISERDSQIINDPKKMNEFVNTWSIPGLYEEGIAPAELGWGTHEYIIPENALFHESGPQNQICLTRKGLDTLVRSWVPSGDIIGMVIRHGEAFGISDRLTVWQDGKAIYRPTVHYAYCVCDAALASIYELKMRQLVVQPKQRIINNEIIDGIDELGCLLLGHDFNAWWIGSVLDIHEARRLVPEQNATTVQVAIGMIAAIDYMIKHPQEGVCLPDDIDHKQVLKIAKPYLGTFISQPVDWSPLQRKDLFFDYVQDDTSPDDQWQFVNFLMK